MKKTTAEQQYSQINTQTGIVDADPHRLIQMLYTGALEKIAVAKGCIQRGDRAGKGEAISKAIGIIGGLQDSINHDVGAASLSDNLATLYHYATERLTHANIHNDIKSLDDALTVLKELQAGWNGIRADVLAAQTAKPETV
jgi:flagellar protein FliS